MSGLPTGTWYGLIPATQNDYYNFTACSELSDDVRFFDATPFSSLHGNAICTVDCVMQHKNAILPLIYPRNTNRAYPCLAKDTVPCDDALSLPVSQTVYIGGVDPISTCGYAILNAVQAANRVNRVEIFDITWGTATDADFSLPAGRYDPNNDSGTVLGGSLFRPYDTRSASFIYYHITQVEPLQQSDYIALMDKCSLSDNADTAVTQFQHDVLQFCRDTYSLSLGTSVVGPTGPLSIIPSATDKKASMWTGCQYVYDISEDVTVTPPVLNACPAIADLCKRMSTGGYGRWSFLPPTITAATLAVDLPNRLCRSFSQTLPARNPPGGQPYVNSVDPQTGTLFMGALDPDLNIITTIQPQAGPSYVYRSCRLQGYDADRFNCCANDFADTQGSVHFMPQQGQPPVKADWKPGMVEAPLFGFDYENTGTPQYRTCFDKTGLTCDPQFRDITSNGCGPLMEQHCTLFPQETAAESWSLSTSGSGECVKWLGRLLYGDQGKWIAFPTIVQLRGTLGDTTGTGLSSGILFNLMHNFQSVFTIDQIATDALTPVGKAMELVMFSLYKSYNLSLYDGGYLVTACSRYTIDYAKTRPNLQRWCGCLLDPNSYAIQYPEIAIECTPTCNSSDVIQYGVACAGTLCILDDVTVSLVDSRGGGVSLTQVCQSCGQVYSNDTQKVRQTCTCKIQDAHIYAIGSSMGNINIKEVCGLDGNGGGSGPSPDGGKGGGAAATAQRAEHAIAATAREFPYAIVALIVGMALLSLMANLGGSRTWSRGLGYGCLIMLLLTVAFVIYRIAVLTF